MSDRRFLASASGLLAALSIVLGAAVAGADVPEVAAEWWTPAESERYEATPGYRETLDFLSRIAARLPELKLEQYGVSAAGRPMMVAIVDRDRVFTPSAARAAGRPVILVINGIHAGEIDGKDACLELLRDVALGRRRQLLEAGTLLIVPVYNVDGHERVSPFHRPNQDGPVRGMGFRTTADGHDLNRDWLKIETPEARAMIELVRRWDPDLTIDDHVTNGSDHDWTLTWAYPEAPQSPPAIASWIEATLPAGVAALERSDFRGGPYVSLIDGADPSKGFETAAFAPRFSTGYFALRKRATVLVEMHSHKPYRQRVAALREFLAGLLTEAGETGRALAAATAAADLEAARSREPLVLDWRTNEAAGSIRFPVYDWRLEPSLVTGGDLLRYRRGELRETVVPWRHGASPARVIARPAGYWVQGGWPQIEERLVRHGVRFERIDEERKVEVEAFRASAAEYAGAPYQGRFRTRAEIAVASELRTMPAGSLWIPAQQPLFDLAAHLLEPEAGDSLFSWGFLSTALERKEYIGSVALEEWATRLLEDESVRAQWQAALADPEFAADRSARYLWWYRRTLHWDEQVGLLPVFRVPAPPLSGER